MNLLRLWLYTCMLCLASNAWANAGSILNILGTAKIQKRTGQIAPAIKGDTVYEGDAVWTESNSNVQIRMADGAMVWIRANSELKIEGYKSTDRGNTKDEVNLRLLSGSLRTVTGLIAKRSPDSYRLSTPSATIGVRGTEFDAVYITPANASQFNAESGTYNRVHQGSTRLSAGLLELVVSEGQAAFVGATAGKAPLLLKEIPGFLNLPANATRAFPAPESSRERIRIAVRFGHTGNKSSETSLQLDSGSLTWVPLPQLVGSIRLPVGNSNMDSGQMRMALTATGPRQGPILLQLGDLQVAGRADPIGQYKLSLQLTPGIWQEVTDQGPWVGVSNVVAQTGTKSTSQKAFILAEEAK